MRARFTWSRLAVNWLPLCSGFALAVAAAGTADATVYLVELEGTVASQLASGTDPNIEVGDTVTMTARFTDDYIYDDGVHQIAAVYGLPASGDLFWNIELNDLVWNSFSEELDGFAFDFDPQGHPLSNPWFELFADGTVAAPHGDLIPAGDTPIFSLGTNGGTLHSGDGLYGNTSVTPGFWVTWNLAGSTFTAVPEPASWTMMLIGFGGIGASMRRRRKQAPIPAF